MADFLTGSEGFFDQAIQTIRHLQEVGIEVSAKTVVTSFNVDRIPKLCEFLVGLLGIKTTRITGYGRSIYRHSDELFASTQKLLRLQDRLETFRKLHPDITIIVGGFTIKEPILTSRTTAGEV